ncbi:MAG TPA: MarR family transcriptional regulator [Sphingomonadaceae bacterium]
MSITRGLDPYHRSLAGTLLAAREAVMAPIRPVLREAGVTEQQWRVLRVLLGEGAMDISQMATAAMLHQPSVTRILRELGSRGLITREADPDDGRRAIATITPRGAALVEDVGRRTLLILDQYSARYGKDRLGALLDELRALTEAIGTPGGLPVEDGLSSGVENAEIV